VAALSSTLSVDAEGKSFSVLLVSKGWAVSVSFEFRRKEVVPHGEPGSAQARHLRQGVPVPAEGNVSLGIR
jgi:endonuclease YncB( thermonuclease family)